LPQLRGRPQRFWCLPDGDTTGNASRASRLSAARHREAKRRLADEYDAAQERGEVASQGKPSGAEGLATTADIGLTHKDIHEARVIRDAEEGHRSSRTSGRSPGISIQNIWHVLRHRMALSRQCRYGGSAF
jgi:hypothetical protein